MVAGEGGQSRFFKTQTTPDDPSIGVMAGLQEAAAGYGLSLDQLLGGTDLVIHGSTVATNTLVERKGARVGLITTDGFRDLLEMREGLKEDRYNLRMKPVEPLAARYLRVGVPERVRANGLVERPLDEAALVENLEYLVQEGAEALAVSFLFSYLNPSHEQQAWESIHRRFPDLYTSLSHEVIPQIKEFDRLSTTVINSYVGPVFSRYLSHLRDSKRFHAEGQAMRRQYNTRQIGAAIDKYLSGMSYKQVCEHLEDFYDVPEPSKRSVHDWVKGYSRLANNFMEGRVGPDGTPETASGRPIEATVGDVWVADEIFLRASGRYRYCWNVMDKDSRYILAAHLSQHRGENDARRVMEKALAAADRPPRKVITDGLDKYPEGIKAVLPSGTVHEVSEGLYEEVNNNISERLQGSIRQRTKTQRGLQNIRTGQDYLDAWVLDYNFFKPHHTLEGKAPAEVAGVAEQVPWGDSWEDIAKMGGEAADPKLKETIATPNKPGPKPDPEGLKSAVEEYLKKKRAAAATAKRKARNVAPVAPYPHRPRPRRRGGRGRMRM